MDGKKLIFLAMLSANFLECSTEKLNDAQYTKNNPLILPVSTAPVTTPLYWGTSLAKNHRTLEQKRDALDAQYAYERDTQALLAQAYIQQQVEPAVKIIKAELDQVLRSCDAYAKKIPSIDRTVLELRLGLFDISISDPFFNNLWIEIKAAITTLHSCSDQVKKLLEKSEKLKQLNSFIEKMIEVIPNKKVDPVSKRLPFNKFIELEEKLPNLYEEVRKSSEDILKISHHTGIEYSIIEQIKKHVFYNEHILDNKISRFDRDVEILDVWQRLVKGDYVRGDLTWLQHEFVESLIMQENNIPWRIAHAIANELYNWENNLKG